MLDKVERWINEHKLLNAGDTVLIACSGGADSVALVHVLNLLRPKYSVSLVAAHVNHLIRGLEGFADAAFVAEFCDRQGIALFSTELDVPAYAKAKGLSLEEAARNLRYQYLCETAASLGQAKVATAHNREDQAETILMHMLRGAGGQGMQGMQAESGVIIRPFLPITRKEIEMYCHEHHLSFRTDSSNACTEYTRNRIRLQLMPFLEQAFNPNIREVLLRTAELIADEHRYVAKCAVDLWPDVACENGDGWILSRKRLRNQHPALRREIFLLAVEKITGSRKGISFRHVEILDRMCQNDGSEGAVNLPGALSAQRSYDRLLIRRGLVTTETAAVLPDIELPLPGQVLLADGRLVRAEFIAAPGTRSDRDTAVFVAGELEPPLIVGSRRPGDRFQPCGFTGTRKLKDFLIDLKVPRSQRDRIPVVRDAKGILWVGGLRQAERGVSDGNAKEFIKLTILDPREEA